MNINKKIWMFWYQGYSEAPYLVHRCIDSWKQLNPGWDVVVLDKHNLHNYIELNLSAHNSKKLLLPHLSDLVRLKLLAKYAGVWADATTYCMNPLDDWLPRFTTTGFFAFRNPGPDRLLGNWFLASEKNNPITIKLCDSFEKYLSGNRFNNEGRFKQLIIEKLGKQFNQSIRTTRYWFSPVVTKMFRVHPYFAFHYLFERVVSNDPVCQEVWRHTPVFNAHDGPFDILEMGLFTPLDNARKNKIDEGNIPVYKLYWNADFSHYNSSSTLYYLFETRENQATGKGV